MTVALPPNILPTDVKYYPVQWATTASKSQSGVTSRRLWGDKPFDARLEIVYNNISDDDAVALCNAWEAAKGPIDITLVPSTYWKGRGSRLIGKIQSHQWSFLEFGAVELAQCQHSRVSVTLVSELRA